MRTMRVEVRGQTGWEVGYERDDRGRITRLDDSRLPGDEPATFTYDAAGRLAAATGPFPFRASWDAAGNPTAWAFGEDAGTATYDSADRPAVLAGAAVEVDAGGRVAALPGVGLTVEHDPFGRLVSATRRRPDGTDATTTLARDAYGAVVRLVVDDDEPVLLLPGPHGHPEAVVDATGATRMLLVGGTRTDPPVVAVEDDRTLLLCCDHLGTVRVVVDVETGELVDERVHDLWGRLVRRSGSSSVPLGWGGGLLDAATGLVHLPTRSHDPSTLRFLARDPLLFRGRSTNLFAFADGDPVNAGDPSGTAKVCRRAWQRWAVPGTDIGETWEHWWAEDEHGNAVGWGADPDSTWNDVTGGYPEVGKAQDHAGQEGECDEVEDVDEECVTAELQRRLGEDLGVWGPGNTCQNFVDEVMSACATGEDGEYTVVTDDPDAYDSVYSPNPNTRAPDNASWDDGGYTPADGPYTPAETGQLWE